MKKLSLVLVLILFATLSVNASGLGLYSIAPKVGVILPESPWNTGFMFGAEADLGELTENLHLVPVVGYWSSKYDLGGADLSLSNIQIGGDVHYFIPSAQGLFVGGGIGLNFLSVDLPSFSFFGQTSGGGSDSQTKFGFGFLAGYMIPINSVQAFVKAKYNLISDFNTFEINAGVAFSLNK